MIVIQPIINRTTIINWTTIIYWTWNLTMVNFTIVSSDCVTLIVEIVFVSILAPLIIKIRMRNILGSVTVNARKLRMVALLI